MGVFPTLVTPHGKLTLPLAERTAARIIDLLLTCDGAAHREFLARQALADDPMLALWTSIGASRDEPSMTAEHLAPRLLAALPRALEWPDQPETVSPQGDIQQAIDELRGRSRCDAADEPFKPADAAALTVESANGEACARLQVLAERLRRLERLEYDFARTLEVEKLDALKELAYGAGHEINNPLANISARAQTLLVDERDPERRRKLAAINTQAFRAYEMIADMMLFARPPQPKLAREDLAPLIKEVVGELSTRAQAQNTELTVAAAERVAARVDKTQLAVALRALVVNALEALGEGGQIEVRLVERIEETTGGKTAEISVADDGPGVPLEVRRHIFDPFYSGREAGRGLGFGLSKCWRIVTLHGGRIALDSIALEGEPAKGARFTIVLPAV